MFPTSLLAATHAEMLKLKRTLALRMTFVAPLLVALLSFFIQSNQLSRGIGLAAPGKGHLLWDTLSREMLSIWAIFLLPLLITLETALLAGIEHSEKQWKHMFALPIPRASIFGAKYVVTQALALLSTLLTAAMVVLSGYLLMVLYPGAGLAASAGPPWVDAILSRALSTWLAAGLLLSIHLWIALRWPSFTVALGAGIGGTFFALFAASAKIGKYYPWLLPVNSINARVPDRMEAAYWLGIAGGIAVAIAACVDFTRREESAPAALSRKAIVAWAAALVAMLVFATRLQSS
jgi:lantibiotic transport system permease protein